MHSLLTLTHFPSASVSPHAPRGDHSGIYEILETTHEKAKRHQKDKELVSLHKDKSFSIYNTLRKFKSDFKLPISNTSSVLSSFPYDLSK